jgi:hypothetical protein
VTKSLVVLVTSFNPMIRIETILYVILEVIIPLSQLQTLTNWEEPIIYKLKPIGRRGNL